MTDKRNGLELRLSACSAVKTCMAKVLTRAAQISLKDDIAIANDADAAKWRDAHHPLA